MVTGDMLNPTSLISSHLGQHITELYLQYFGHRRPEFASYLGGAAKLILGRIGQMADPFYHRKINALYWEFLETGMAEKLAYSSAADLVEKYPEFFWSKVEPYIEPALRYLEVTTSGKQWIANLHRNVFRAEHRPFRIGPFPGAA